jgi:hypothetical protein
VLVKLGEPAGRDDADCVVGQLLLLYEGALSALLVGHVEDPIAQARAVAHVLLSTPHSVATLAFPAPGGAPASRLSFRR